MILTIQFLLLNGIDYGIDDSSASSQLRLDDQTELRIPCVISLQLGVLR